MTTLAGDFVDYSYDMTKHIVDSRLVVGLKEKQEEYRKRIVAGLREYEKAKKAPKAAKGA